LDWPVDDCTIAVFKFKNKVIGKVFCSIGCIRPYTMRSILYGTKGTIICDNSSSFIQISSKNLSTKKHPPFEKIPVNIASHDILAEVNEFVDCIIKDKSPVINAEEGAKTVSVCVSVVKSAKEGKPIKVESAF
jgi:predicted dehydrogenase